MGHDAPIGFEMDQMEAEGMPERWEMQNERVKSLVHSEGESNGGAADGMHATCTSACGQHNKLKDELTHLLYPLSDPRYCTARTTSLMPTSHMLWSTRLFMPEMAQMPEMFAGDAMC